LGTDFNVNWFFCVYLLGTDFNVNWFFRVYLLGTDFNVNWFFRVYLLRTNYNVNLFSDLSDTLGSQFHNGVSCGLLGLMPCGFVRGYQRFDKRITFIIKVK
jgi:hypothetical protein